MLKTTLTFALLTTVLGAQQMVPGALHGSTLLMGVGDVDDDGYDDYMMRLAQTWAVHSGQTGQLFAHLTPPSFLSGPPPYLGLRGDLNGDGYDDLALGDIAAVIRYISGIDGTELFRLTGPEIDGLRLAADHNGDGYDDVMIRTYAAITASGGTYYYDVHSGKDGSLLDSYSKAHDFGLYTGWVDWCGDVNGDGYVDLIHNDLVGTVATAEIFAGPDFTTSLRVFPNSTIRLGADTNGDGADEVLNDSGEVLDVGSGLTIWDLSASPSYLLNSRIDVDGDGAHDLVGYNEALSGRTQQPWPWATPAYTAFSNLGDIDADGRDELANFERFYELQGGPVASYVRDRGHGGLTSTGSRPRIDHRTRPRLGGSFLMDLRGGGGPNLAFLALGSQLDVDLSPLGATGNRAYVAPIVAPWLVADTRGVASFVLGVPNTTALVGAGLSAQWAVADAAANALGIVTSNALDFVVGN